MEEISKYHDLLEVIDTYFNGKPKKELIND